MGELQRLQLRCRRLHPNTCPRGGATKEQLKDEVEDAMKRLASNVDLFDEVDGEGQAQ